ncbi:hypothetical protein WCWAEYFT_CDS0276 [Vibrio phage VB_VaC_TDDLMA]
MIKVPETSELADFNIADYSTPPLEKYTDRRGYLYIVFDSAFPDYIKVGRTSDCKKRLIGYNSDRPYPTVKMLFISEMFEDVNEMERRVLSYMYDNTPPTTLSKEWFEIQHKDKLIEIIEKAEREYSSQKDEE